MAQPILIGIVAGCVSAVLYFSVAFGVSFIGVVLFYIAPLPILIAGFGYGVTAAFVGAASGAIAAGISFSFTIGSVYLLACALPAAWLARLALLARRNDADGPQGALEWYPVTRLIMWCAALGAGLVLAAVLAFDPGGEDLKAAVKATFERFAQEPQGSPFASGDIDTDAVAAWAAYYMPPISAALWTLTMAGNLWLASRIAAASGRSVRPRFDLSSLELPHWFAMTFAAALLMASFLPAPLGTIGLTVSAAMSMTFLMLGLVIIHLATRGMTMRPLILGAVYMGVFIFIWAAPLVTALGLADPMFNLRKRALARAQST